MESQTPGMQNLPDAPEAIRLEEAIHSLSPEILKVAASDARITEDLALTLLQRSDLPDECLTLLSKNLAVSTRRKVRVAIVKHSRTPRHVSLPLLRLLYVFDLMAVALTPVLAADIKRAAEQVLRGKLETLSSGEKIALGRRASGNVAAELLLDSDSRVMRAVLANPRLTEISVCKTLARKDASASLVEAVSRHPQWSLSREVKIALLKNGELSLARALELARGFSPKILREILHSSRLPQVTKDYLLRCAAQPAILGESQTSKSRATRNQK